MIRFTIINLLIILLVVFNIITPQIAAYPAALLTFVLFLWYMKKEDDPIPFYQPMYSTPAFNGNDELDYIFLCLKKEESLHHWCRLQFN